MAQAFFVSGDPIMVPYMPSSNVAAGDVIVAGDKTYIAHSDIAAGATNGAVAAGGGIYRVTGNGGSGGDVIAFGTKVFWDDSGDVAGDDSSGNNPFGWAAADKAEEDTTFLIEHGAW